MTDTHPAGDSAADPDHADRVRAACQALIAAGADITFTAVAQASGISRATCYRRRDCARSSTPTAPDTANCSPSPGWPTASTTSPKP